MRDRVKTLWTRAPWHNADLRALAGTSGANFLVLGINMITGALTARVLEPVGRGELAAVILWPQFLGFALALGLPTALIYHLQQRRHDAAVLIGTAVSIALMTAVAGSVIGILLVPLSLNAYSSSTVRVAQLCMVFTPASVAMALMNAVFLQQGRITRYNLIRVISPVVTLILLAAMAVAGRLTIAMAALAYLAPVVPIAIWTIAGIHRSAGIRIAVHRAAGRDLLGYGLRYYGAELAGTLSSQVDRVVVVMLLSPEAMGLYVVALSFSRVFQQVPLSLSTLLLPKVTGRSAAEIVRVTGRAAILSAALSLVTALPVLLFGSTLLALFFGRDFATAGTAFSILTLEALASGCATVYTQAFLAVGRPGRMSLYQAISLGAMVPLLLWWGPRYGIVGISMANLASTLFSLLFLVAGVYRLPRMVAATPPLR